jgi:hypothetical protein
MVKLLEEMFQDTSSWSADEQVCPYHIGMERDTIRRLGLYYLPRTLEILRLSCMNAGIGQIHLSRSRLRR